ncbi:hypothetical protein N7513_002791 [Penicillium frequentans]|nr:hypothetical protein N7513_002791 [Penicillium glabrum]
MDDIEHNEPIFGLAEECETLFAEQISRLNDVDEPNGATILSELNQRFAAWAAFLGVFAESRICLDHRLRRHVEIQDQVLLLLDLVQRNLTFLFEPDHSPERMEMESLDEIKQLQVSISSLEAISGAIERLNHLGIAIRQSSVTSQTTKTRKFAETFDFTSFEEIANLSLRTLYTDASEGLLEQLTRCMTETYALFLRRKSRQERLKAPRNQIMLSPIQGQSATDANVGSPTKTENQVPEPGRYLNSEGLRSTPPRAFYKLPHSEPTSVDTQEVKSKFRKMLSPCSKAKTISILVNRVDYPQPTKGSLTCDWCFSPLPTDSLVGVNWRHHVNEDHKPYVCISEKCSESLPRYATSTQWFQHMLTTHGQNWHQEVHAPWSWVCPLGREQGAAFSKPFDLVAHLKECHEDGLSESAIQAMSKQSRVRCPRPRDMCPLCCRSIKDQDDHLAKDTENDSRGSCSNEPHYTGNLGCSRLLFKPDMGQKMSDQNCRDGHETEQPEPEIVVNPCSSKPPSVEAIASHVAAHLQNVMLLTLRLISIDVAIEVSAGGQSVSGEIDDQSSWVGSGNTDPDQEMKILADFPIHGELMMEPADMTPSEDLVPDSEFIDWHGIPGYYGGPIEDRFPLDSEWEKYRDELKSLWLDKRWTLKQVQEHMSQAHNFSKSESQFIRQFKRWGFKKYLTDPEWNSVARRAGKRKREGKEPGSVRVNGKLISESNIRKQKSGYS